MNPTYGVFSRGCNNRYGHPAADVVQRFKDFNIPTYDTCTQGTITFISPKAEFTPRNVQTAEERSKLVYRIKVTADNRNGVLKPGMPVEAELQPQKQ